MLTNEPVAMKSHVPRVTIFFVYFHFHVCAKGVEYVNHSITANQGRKLNIRVCVVPGKMRVTRLCIEKFAVKS